MASHLRSINDSAWQRVLEGDVPSAISGHDLSFILCSAGVLVMFFGLILYCRHCLRPYIEEEAEREWQRESQPEGLKMSTEQRKAYISKLLVTKQVLASGSTNGASTEKYENMVLPRLTSSVHNDAEDEEDEERQDLCPICLEEYKVGDEICWSHSEVCAHVFHRECVFEWLVRHDECPTCRQNFISLDGIGEHEPQDGEHESDDYELELARTFDMSSEEGSVIEYAAPRAIELSPRVSILSIILQNLGVTRARTNQTDNDRPLEGVSDSIHGIRAVTSMDETDEYSPSSGMEDIELGDHTQR